MIRLALAACLFATPLIAADSKEVSCGYQGQVISAIQQARLDRVKEQDVAATIAASNPSWPAQYSKAIPGLTPWVYQQKMRDLRKNDLGAVMREQCIENWDQIQAMQKNLNN